MKKDNSKNLLLILFLLGIFMGALDTGIVSPARTVIANSFNISANTSIWIITIYTLAYAVAMPIAGKLSDNFGKKKIYIISISLFGIGSLLCGLSNFYGNFSLLLVARVIQAIGGGGIMPIATAYIGDSFPPEKKGAALGMVGGIYGIATTLGPSVGSGILNIVGNSNWGVLFFINVPICLIILILSILSHTEEKIKASKKIDIKGSILISLTILSLMYGLTNLKFYEFLTSIKSIDVWPYLLAFIILLPILVFAEKKAEDPVLNLKYFTNKEISLALIIAFIVGAGMMGVVFVPQFGENILKIKSGSGGYIVTIMAIFSGISAPISGKLVDRFSAKIVLISGFTLSAIGTLTLALYAANHPSFFSLLIGLLFVGLGMGCTMGAPLNYIVQINVNPEETATAQSTLSLIRSIGVAISPNILIGFISQAGKNMSTKLMEVIPKMEMPQIQGMQAPAANMTSNTSGISQEQLQLLQNADVTTIVDSVKKFSEDILNDKVAPAIQQMTSVPNYKGPNADSLMSTIINSYLKQIEDSRLVIENVFQSTLNSGYSKLFIGAAVIAILGLISSLLLSKNRKNS
ncbi:MFS transporter [Clostridium cellulovorans]|uniref:Drug resistance transporter, EmrB/QacA subfamily n=1 Tax=Clostridium cellulovorans (strain ATCC 35296 / DSM 3052 / OCM 3 / 743B) TaxID=573061 RepID=D9SMH6_CLOC7|nr:MFS transporter [Clostridium cellulovorans]ADL53832.1 drug resistance transporter, EmrB/QacA subfamily [Clostridium cellulovorans 743B]